MSKWDALVSILFCFFICATICITVVFGPESLWH